MSETFHFIFMIYNILVKSKICKIAADVYTGMDV
jgi:hypothetical protein